MNQKLRTARSGMVILFAVLCIVCLSLSLALSAHFAAYAEGENGATLNSNDGKGHDLWLVHYDGQEEGKPLWGGIDSEGKPIAYIDSHSDADGNYVVKHGTDDDKDCFAPYRGVTLTLKLNPDYETENGTLGSLYNLDEADYTGNAAMGGADMSTDMHTSVTVQPLSGSAATEALSLEKTWMIATLCNTVNARENYITDHPYAAPANLELLRPEHGNLVVYDISSSAYDIVIAVQYNGDQTIYLQAGKGESGYFLSMDENNHPIAWDLTEQNAAANANVNLIYYLIRGLDALDASSNTKAYTLTVTAMDVPAEIGDIQYVQSSKQYGFNVNRQRLGNDEENDTTFEANFEISFENRSVEYTKGNECIQSFGLELRLHGILLVEGTDYTVDAENHNVGYVDLRIMGSNNLEGYHTIKGEDYNLRILPARNELKQLNIISWMYGTYNAENNVIIADTEYLDNPNDITFSIEKIIKDKEGKITGTKAIEALSNFHYDVDTTTGETNGIVTADVIEALGDLDAGEYRLYVSVYGVYATDQVLDRNYEPIAERSIDFTVFVGINRWKAGAEPSIGGWTAGKLESTDGLMNAEPVFGTSILMIYDIEDNLIYSNLPEHANTDFGDINVLKGLKAGRYYLSASVDGTSNYAEIRATVLFDVVPNNLPVWAVILIVAGSLGIVALVFGILHQKGILQMLTGKVIISMRTRANVDATLAAIRAAKVAREAEASIAAAKAREAEEAAKSEKSDK